MSEVTVRIIKSEADYKAAIARIDEIFDAQAGTPESDELDVLLLLVDHYQRKHNVIAKAEPVEVIKFMMEQNGLKQKDLAKYLGSESRVSEVLKGKRQLTLEMIKNLSEGLHIPVEALI